MTEHMTRDALVEAAADALVDFTPIGVWRDGRVLIPVEQFAPIAVDAVLWLVADDLDAQADEAHEPWGDAWDCGNAAGIEYAARSVRSLLPSTEGDPK